MYFPYLYGRRSELLALRAIVPEFDIRETVVPIFEPVKADSGDLRRGMRALGEAEVKTIIVTNPAQGEFKASRGNPAASVPTWRASIGAEFSEFPSNIPGFLCRPEIRIADITAFLNRYPDREVALIYWSPRLTNAELRSLVAERRIQFHVNLHDSLSADQRRILPTRKAVDITDRFNSQIRNADYGEPEFFSDKHLTFQADSIGFGDFSVIGSTFSAGGGPAHAVAIHAVYKDPAAGTLWVEHFISDDTDIEIGTTAEKFLQAARKLVRAAGRRRAEFGNNEALRGYSEDVTANTSPGLMANKRRQIHHHVAANHLILTGAL